MGFIYKITNSINNKVYIGKTEKENPNDRFKQHLCDSGKIYKNIRPLYSAIKKYGKHNFNFEILEETENASDREKFYIDFYNSYKNGYNATIGGDGRQYITNQKEIIEYFNSNNFLLIDVANHFNIHPQTLKTILDKFKIDYNKFGRRKLKVYKFLKDGTFVESFNDCRSAAISIGNIKLNSHISECCKNKRKTASGFIWKYHM